MSCSPNRGVDCRGRRTGIDMPVPESDRGRFDGYGSRLASSLLDIAATESESDNGEPLVRFTVIDDGLLTSMIGSSQM